MDTKKVKDKCQEVCNEIQARLAGFNKGPKLHEDIKDKDEKIAKLTDEVKMWHERFDAMWKAWHVLAVDTKGKEEADKMASQLKAGK